MKEFIQKFTGLFIISGTIIILDQFTKHYVRSNLPLGQVFHPELWISKYARIVHWYNTGVTGGLFQNLNTIHIVLNTIIAAVLIFIYSRTPKDDKLTRLALALMLGGGVGNIIDRLLQGHVTDFLSVGNFPVFNIADACVSIGAALLFISLVNNYFIQRREPLTEPETNEQKDNQDSSSTHQSQQTSKETQR